jgi:hypothetical protein
MPKRYLKTTKRRGYRRKVGTKTKVTKAVKSYVKRTLDKNQEDKYNMLSYNGTISLTAASGSAVTSFDLQPISVQGVGVGSHIGSRFRVKNAWFNYRFTLNGAAQSVANDMPLFVYMMIARPRNSPDTVTTTETDQLFYSGDNTVSNFVSGDSQAQWWRPNTDFWDIRYWTRRAFKLGSATGSGTALYANNDFKAAIEGRINMKKFYNKIIRFNNTSSFAQGNNWYALFFVQKYDYTISTTDWDPPRVEGQINIVYEDA